MKSVFLSLLLAFFLAACTNYGKKIKVEGTKGEVYYKGDGVTVADAEKTGEFLKKEKYFNSSTGASVRLSKNGEDYLLQFSYKREVYDTLKGIENLFKIIAARVSREVFDGKKVDIELTNKLFKAYKTIPYDEEVAKSLEEPATNKVAFRKNDFEHEVSGGVNFYWKDMSDEESKNITDYIAENGAFRGGTAEIYMTKENDRYILRFPMIESARTDGAILSSVEKLTKEIKDNVFANVPYSFIVTDELLQTVKSWDY